MLRLRPFRTIDAKTIITWTSEPSEFYMWSAGLLGDFPVSEQKLLEAVSARENNPRYFPLVSFDENEIKLKVASNKMNDLGSILFSNVGYKIVEDIKNGHINNYILKPISCFKYFLTSKLPH